MTANSRERALEFRHPSGERVNGLPLFDWLKELFALLAPGCALPDEPLTGGRTYNWGSDKAYWTVDGDGILIAEYCFGAVPGDGLELIFHLSVGKDISVVVTQGLDYSQHEYEFRVVATSETIDVVTDALLQTFESKDLVLVRRTDLPTKDVR